MFDEETEDVKGWKKYVSLLIFTHTLIQFVKFTHSLYYYSHSIFSCLVFIKNKNSQKSVTLRF